ncbi:MAG: hypothetical protein E7L38_21415 [Klebsiella pneumoniae]|nr:hypothetical protein [Klebsiella pneumoniae]
MKALVLDQIDNRTVATVKDIDRKRGLAGRYTVRLPLGPERRSPAPAAGSAAPPWCC